MRYFVTAIHTDSGKTISSAILCEALKADYWKPVQAGKPFDSDAVRTLVSNGKTFVHPEKYVLQMPASPHAAAKAEGRALSVADINLPSTQNDLIIEGAGGCLVPLNENDFVIDLAVKFKCHVILVSNLYLGSINHTLLTVEALKTRNVKIEGIIFNGTPNKESEEIILHHTKLKPLLKIFPEQSFSKDTVIRYAKQLDENWK